MKKSYMDTQFDRRILVLNKIIIAFIVLITLVPMIYIIVASFMDPKVLATRGISFNPEDWTVSELSIILIWICNFNGSSFCIYSIPSF